MNSMVCAQAGHGLQEKAQRIVAELKAVGKDLYNLVSSKKDAKKESGASLAYESSKNEPVIESCDHCKDLCAKDQGNDLFA